MRPADGSYGQPSAGLAFRTSPNPRRLPWRRTLREPRRLAGLPRAWGAGRRRAEAGPLPRIGPAVALIGSLVRYRHPYRGRGILPTWGFVVAHAPEEVYGSPKRASNRTKLPMSASSPEKSGGALLREARAAVAALCQAATRCGSARRRPTRPGTGRRRAPSSAWRRSRRPRWRPPDARYRRWRRRCKRFGRRPPRQRRP